MQLFDEFPNLKNEKIIIRKMLERDVDALMEITNNDNVYKYIPPFLYKKSRNFLLSAIKNIGGRDFEKKKLIIAGIYLQEEPSKLIGLAEMFDYKKKANQLTIGYRLNEAYWHQGIASSAVELMIDYLCNIMGINILKAFVMQENIYSQRILLKKGFKKDTNTVQEKGWGGEEISELNVFTYIHEE